MNCQLLQTTNTLQWSFPLNPFNRLSDQFRLGLVLKKKTHQNVEVVIDMFHGRSLKGPSVGTCNILQTCVVVQVTQMLFIPQIIRLPRCVFACRISMTFSMGCDR